MPLAILNVVPIPGVGAMMAGWRNPHTSLRWRGLAQFLLVVFGSWPLIIPGVAGFLWAIYDAWWMYDAPRLAPPQTDS